METKDTLSSCSNSEAQQMQQIQDKAKKSCMVSFRQLHSHLNRLSKNDLQGSRTESEFKRAFAIIFGQDIKTFTGTMFLNVEQLEKQLDKEDFQEIGSMAAFNVHETQFQMFIVSRLYLDDEYKSIDERALHKREYARWVNERPMQTKEEKVDTSKALNVGLVDKESSGTESKEQDTCSRSWNDAHDIGQQHTEQPEFNNEGEVDQNAEECHETCPLPAILIDNQIPEHSYQSLKSENIWQHSQFLKEKSNEAKVKHDIDVIETINIELEHKVAKLLKENETLKKHYKELFDSIKITRAKTIEHTTSLIASNDNFKAQLQEKGFIIAALKNELRKLKRNSVNTKFAKQSILGKPMLQSHRNQSIVRQPTAFKSERPRISEPRFASQIDVNNDLSKPVTTHYLPKEREFASSKPHHMIASSNSRNSSKNMPRFSSNDMVHNHYLEEAKKQTQERSRNSQPSLMPSARSQCTANGSKPNPRSNTQTSKNWPTSKNSFVTTKTQCVFSANHNSCLTKLLNEVNSRAKVPSNKTTNRNKPVEQISVSNTQERQIPTGHRFSNKKTFIVQKKTMTPRYCLRWKPTGRIFNAVGLRWVPTGKIFASSTTKVDSEPLSGSNADITNQYECEQTLDGFKEFSTDEQAKTSDHNSSELGLHDYSNEQSSLKLVPNVVPPADKTDTSRQELEFLFHHHITC
nr:hypothetical protein [Tanacetum cinerariifolium]